jgi:hypothetical protein
MEGKPGKYMSIENGPIAERSPSISMSTLCLRFSIKVMSSISFLFKFSVAHSHYLIMVENHLMIAGSLWLKNRLSLVSIDLIESISSFESSKSNTFMFSFSRSFRTDFGITTTPR